MQSIDTPWVKESEFIFHAFCLEVKSHSQYAALQVMKDFQGFAPWQFSRTDIWQVGLNVNDQVKGTVPPGSLRICRSRKKCSYLKAPDGEVAIFISPVEHRQSQIT